MHPLDQKVTELMIPVQRQIMMCDDDQELLIFCFGMLNKCKDILDNTLGEEKRKQLFKEHS